MNRVRERTVWHEVLDTRRRWHANSLQKNAEGPMETWRADETTLWLPIVSALASELVGRILGTRDGDPRQALIDLMAVCSAWAKGTAETRRLQLALVLAYLAVAFTAFAARFD